MNQLVPISSPTLPAPVAAVSVGGCARRAEYLIGYLNGAGLRGDPKGPLFRAIGRGTGKLTRTVRRKRTPMR